MFNEENGIDLLGKLHELAFYGLLATIFCLLRDKITIDILISNIINYKSFKSLFIMYLFWSTVLFFPVAIIAAYRTKHNNDGLTFSSNNIIVIIFAHIAEELLGLILTPIWTIMYTIKKDWDFYKILDTILYFIEVIFIIIGLYTIFNT